MSSFRPYYNAEQFRYPEDVVSKSAAQAQMAFPLGGGDERMNGSGFDYSDLDELVAGHSQISAVGMSVSRFYARMLVSQPFEVSRFSLQVGDFGRTKAGGSSLDEDATSYEDYDFETETSSSDEDVDYFVDVRDTAKDSAANEDAEGNRDSAPKKRQKLKVKPSKSRGMQLFNSAVKDPLFPEASDTSGGPFVFSTLGALSQKEGVFGSWHAMNASCLYRAATGVIQAWTTSFFASFFNIPDPQFVDMLQAIDPLKSLIVSTAGCAVAAALLAPLAIIRARLIATSMTKSDRPRSLRWSLSEIVRRGQLLAPAFVILPTTFAAASYHLIMSSAPLVMWRTVGLSQFSSPKLYQIAQLVTNMLGLLVKMPLETLASRAQLKASHPSARSLIVKPVYYAGMSPTLWGVVTGQVAVSTLYRGWRTEVVGMLGEWGYDALDEGKPTQQERF